MTGSLVFEEVTSSVSASVNSSVFPAVGNGHVLRNDVWLCVVSVPQGHNEPKDTCCLLTWGLPALTVPGDAHIYSDEHQ